MVREECLGHTYNTILIQLTAIAFVGSVITLLETVAIEVLWYALTRVAGELEISAGYI